MKGKRLVKTSDFFLSFYAGFFAHCFYCALAIFLLANGKHLGKKQNNNCTERESLSLSLSLSLNGLLKKAVGPCQLW